MVLLMFELSILTNVITVAKVLKFWLNGQMYS